MKKGSILFTERQRSVATLAVQGMSYADIGTLLNLSVRTVEAYIAETYAKMRKVTGDETFKSTKLIHLLLALGIVDNLYKDVDASTLAAILRQYSEEMAMAVLATTGHSDPDIARQFDCTDKHVSSSLSSLYTACRAYLGDNGFDRTHLTHLLLQCGMIEQLYPNPGGIEGKFLKMREEAARARHERVRSEHKSWTILDRKVVVHLAAGLPGKVVAARCGLKRRSVESVIYKIVCKVRARLGDNSFGRRDIIRIFSANPRAPIEVLDELQPTT